MKMPIAGAYLIRPPLLPTGTELRQLAAICSSMVARAMARLSKSRIDRGRSRAAEHCRFISARITGSIGEGWVT
jgi:hypothetical protein